MRIALLLLLLSLAWTARAEPYVVDINNNRSPGATLYVAVYAGDAGSWEAEPLVRHKVTLTSEPSLTLPLDLAPGAYAIRAFVDLDGDGVLALNTKDRPAEPFASSIGAGRYKPSVFFRRSVLVFDEHRSNAELTLRYPKGTDSVSEQKVHD